MWHGRCWAIHAKIIRAPFLHLRVHHRRTERGRPSLLEVRCAHSWLAQPKLHTTDALTNHTLHQPAQRSACGTQQATQAGVAMWGGKNMLAKVLHTAQEAILSS